MKRREVEQQRPKAQPRQRVATSKCQVSWAHYQGNVAETGWSRGQAGQKAEETGKEQALEGVRILSHMQI